MNYATIKPNDIANGEGVRVSLFVSGCNIHCEDCFNKEAWDFDYGQEFTYDTLTHLLDLVDRPYIQGLSILGGEPLAIFNIETVELIISMFRFRFGNSKDIWLYTGYDLNESGDIFFSRLMKLADVIVDGPFIKDKKDPSLWFKGSSNQRIIDTKASVQNGALLDRKLIVEWSPK